MKTHQLVGYDPVSERPEFSLQVPDAQLYTVFRFDPDDPEGVFAYKLDYSKVSDLTGIMRRGKPPGNLEYFIEPYP
jgi:hypothetical protein